MGFAGRHLICDLWGIPEAPLRDAAALSALLLGALKAAGMRVLGGPVIHSFREGGEGVTCAVLLQESHATFHTYPEAGCMMLDVYACGEADPEQVLASVSALLSPSRVDRVLLRRGELSANASRR